VLFDEGNDLSGYLLWAKMTFQGAYSGERCLTVSDRDAVSCAPWQEGMKVFGETLPNWDFEIVKEPKPGQYRYLQFAWKGLKTGSTSAYLQLQGTGDVSPQAVTLYAGKAIPEGTPNPNKVADTVPREWRVVRIDLWNVFKKPVRIRGLRLSSTGGPTSFDQIVLGRTEKDLPRQGKN
jgi:hypothetical protein